MKKIIAIIFIVIAYAAIASSPIKFHITGDELDSHGNKVRICGVIESEPHTSCRIDSISMIESNGKRIVATDIDGVDFQRYFQWEDDGEISVEIEFPLVCIPDSANIVLHTVRGDLIFGIK